MKIKKIELIAWYIVSLIFITVFIVSIRLPLFKQQFSVVMLSGIFSILSIGLSILFTSLYKKKYTL